MVAYVTKSINKLYLFVSEEGENELIQTEVEGEEENEEEEVDFQILIWNIYRE